MRVEDWQSPSVRGDEAPRRCGWRTQSRGTGLRASLWLTCLLMTLPLVTTSCGKGSAPNLPDPTVGAPASGSYQETLRTELDERRRTYRVHIPSGYTGSERWPLVVVVHGAFNTGRGMEEKTGFSELADREGFLVAYPDGIGLRGLFQHWNAGFCCGKALRLGIDDVGFLDQMIQRLSDRLAVDPQRIYMIGESNGAMLTYLYASRHPSRLAAAGVSAGATGGIRGGARDPDGELFRIEPPEHPVPLIAFHGLADDRVPFSGRDDGITVPVEEGLERWAQANGCEPDPATEEQRQGTVHHRVWNQGPACAPVELYTLEGWPHQWPGERFTRKLEGEENSALAGFDAAEVAWGFFEGYPN
ncbi:MAG: PHB depolymerase family esterase [Acidobacteriota bacterium]|nr:PHB depolymerase family esterase [Acidobacteriota bacterium]